MRYVIWYDNLTRRKADKNNQFSLAQRNSKYKNYKKEEEEKSMRIWQQQDIPFITQ